jgi:predicted dehydrogenase
MSQGIAARRRYAIVGTGSRSQLYQDAIQRDYSENSVLVALCDSNPHRLAFASRRSPNSGSPLPGVFAADDFENMIRATAPDTVIVTSPDYTHRNYIVRAMELGCDVITEKPMTTTAADCAAILEAQRRTGRRCRVTFNYRYSPPRSQVKDLLMGGEIGDVLSADFHWLLNTHHGADYFRRWHSRKRNSGGLMVHKATHHFDLVNWWLGAMPVSVMATGKRAFYTPQTARRFGLTGAHERCHTCPERAKCTFGLDLSATEMHREMYLNAEPHDGYFRDRCVFRDDMDIEDTMSVSVRYDTGAILTYSLNAFNAWEGYMIAFNGTKGRIEHSIVEQSYVSGDGTVQGGTREGGVTTRVIPLRGEPRELTPWSGQGDHGGGDRAMLVDILSPQPPPDKYLRGADMNAGAASIMVGIAANRSFETHAEVSIAGMLPGMERPDYAPMPDANTPLEMPQRIEQDGIVTVKARN